MKMSSTLAVALIAISLLMFAAASIMRNITAVPANAMQSAVAAGLQSPEPVVNIQQPARVQPALVVTPFVSDPPVRFMTAEEEAQFNNHEWLAVAYDRGVKNVWGGAWFPCRHIDPVALTYNTIRTDPSLVVWQELGNKEAIVNECRKP